MTVLSPYSSKFTDVLKESKDLFNQGGLQTKEERTQFIKSKGLDPDEFRKTYKEYEEIEAKDNTEFKITLKHLLDKHVSKGGEEKDD